MKRTSHDANALLYGIYHMLMPLSCFFAVCVPFESVHTKTKIVCWPRARKLYFHSVCLGLQYARTRIAQEATYIPYTVLSFSLYIYISLYLMSQQQQKQRTCLTLTLSLSLVAMLRSCDARCANAYVPAAQNE